MLFTPGASRASVGAPKLDRLRQRRGRSSCCVSARACVFEVLAVETVLAAVRRTTKIQCAQTVVDGLHANFIRSSRLSPFSRPFTVTSNSSFLPFSACPLVIHVRWCKERATLHVGFPLLCECTFMCACVFVCVCVADHSSAPTPHGKPKDSCQRTSKKTFSALQRASGRGLYGENREA